MLVFDPITIESRSIMDRYTCLYGEKSCQNSFVSSFTHKEKYGDQICVINDFLVVLRSKQCNDRELKFLFPIGDRSKRSELKECINEIIEYSKQQKKTLVFDGILSESVKTLEDLYPGLFEFEDFRDGYEYIYDTKKYLKLAGKEYASRRNEINCFKKTYEERSEIRTITADDISSIKEFQRSWTEKIDDKDLLLENDEILMALDYYVQLDLRGIFILIDGKIAGYVIGSPLSENVMDYMFIKGLPKIRHIYTALIYYFDKTQCHDMNYMNWEEDLGLEGLRQFKESFHPEILLEKKIAKLRKADV